MNCSKCGKPMHHGDLVSGDLKYHWPACPAAPESLPMAALHEKDIFQHVADWQAGCGTGR
jgi:hypothetical protein